MKDIRIATGFIDHPKTKKLIKRVGVEAVSCLLRLWLWAAQNRCKGVFSNMDEEDIEIVSGWNGDDGLFLSSCEDIGWLDRTDGVLELHDWQDWQPWVYGAEDRSDKARLSRMAKTHPQIFAEQKAKGYDAVSAEKYASLTAAQRNVNDALTPSPSPSPPPSPNDSQHKKSGQKSSFPETATPFRLAQYLFMCIRNNNPNAKPPNLQKWAKHVDLMLRLDERDPKEVEKVIRWVKADNMPDKNGFCWAFNVLSTQKLRKQYDQLVMRMKGGQGECSMSSLPPELRG